jgi:hypothetical protein
MPEIPENFKTTVNDLLSDLNSTYPEHAELWKEWTNTSDDSLIKLFEYMTGVFPERFFDILYQNEDIFAKDCETNVCFLPGVDFKLLYNCEGISDNTKKTLWKYLQLLLFTTIGSIDDKSKFGDAADLFNGINEDDLHTKLKETMEGITGFFGDMGENINENSGTDSSNNKTEFTFDASDNVPDMEGLHEHLKGIFDGKIGGLAKELAEEISGEFEDMMKGGHEKSTEDIMKKLMKNPKKMMDMVKTVGDKLQKKMDSGDISKEELMQEAQEILSKMKDMGGSKEMNEMFKKFASGMGLGKNAKIDINALTRMTQQGSTRDRLRNKMNERANDRERKSNLKKDPVTGKMVFSVDGEDKQERSSAEQNRLDDELIASFGGGDNNNDAPKKKKGKKKRKGKK